MNHMTNNPEQVLDSVIRELCDAPVDLLLIGDGGAESAYLEHSRCSYIRTLREVLSIFDALQMERRQIRILEIGSYLGVVSCSLARMGFDVTALDIPEFMSNERLKAKYTSYSVSTISANLRDYYIPSESASFSLIIMCETLEHLNFNPLPVISELNRLLVTDGQLYLSMPNQASLPNRLKLLSGRSIHNPVSDFEQQLSRRGNMIVGIHWREYTAEELSELLLMGGFSTLQHDFYTTHNACLPARIVYSLFPKLRVNQTVLARKTSVPRSDFCFTDAVR